MWLVRIYAYKHFSCELLHITNVISSPRSPHYLVLYCAIYMYTDSYCVYIVYVYIHAHYRGDPTASLPAGALRPGPERQQQQQRQVSPLSSLPAASRQPMGSPGSPGSPGSSGHVTGGYGTQPVWVCPYGGVNVLVADGFSLYTF